MPGRRRALLLDWGGTLTVTRDNRTVVDASGHPGSRPTWRRVWPPSGRATRRASSCRRPFTDWRLCPHGDEHRCDCRKPRPGMFLDLARAWHLDLSASTHVGDSAKDRDAAEAAGVGTFVWARDFFGW